MGSGVRKSVVAQFVERGVVREEKRRLLGVLPSTRHPEADGSAEDELRARVRAVLVDGAEPSERTAALIAIAQAGGLGKALVVDVPWKQVSARAKEVAEGDWAATAVRKAVQSVNAAVIVATMAATTVTVAGS